MKHIAYAVLVLSMATCQAQSNKWQISEVYDSKNVIAGYIMHTYALGTVATEKVQKNASGLRIICAAQPSSPPIVGVYWNRISPVENYQSVTVSIDKRVLPPKTWIQDDTLIFLPFPEIPQVVKEMKTGKNIKFEWTTQALEKHSVSFDLEGMPIKDFNQFCKI